MAHIVTAAEATARLRTLLEDVSAGEEIEITPHGRVFARLTPASDSAGPG